jgi:hypothetical protein
MAQHLAYTRKQQNETPGYLTRKKNQLIQDTGFHLPVAGHYRYYFQDTQLITMLTIILILAGLIGFALFFKAIDFFEKI